jgi:hypothetical protein
VTTDRELLELAAKAFGMKNPNYMEIYQNKGINRGATEPLWNPLKDDGDALRLAVKLRLCIDNCVGEEGDRNDVTVGEEAGQGVFVDEYHGNDPYAATRRAIVMAAAEIGRAMK